MRAGDYGDYTERAWERREVGVWYGAWTADDFRQALDQAQPHEFLSALPEQQKLVWRVSPQYFQTTKRFADISRDDWVVVCFKQKIHFARLVDEFSSSRDHAFNLPNGEQFKFRRIEPVKSFALASLPEPFRLIPQAGRGNVFEYRGLGKLIELLVESSDEAEITSKIASLPLGQWLEILGPGGWESTAFAYLILEEDFVPTGLAVGRSLAVFDIVGRNSRTGEILLGQCKKTPYPVSVPAECRAASAEYHQGAKVFFFAYSGCSDDMTGIITVSKENILEWLQTATKGQNYRRLLIGS